MTTTMTATGHERYVEAFDGFLGSRGRTEPGTITRLRREAIESFERRGFPTIREEEWRFTNVAPIARTQFQLSPAATGVTAGDVERFSYPGCARIVLVNGKVAAEFTDLSGLPDELIVCGMAEALERHPEKVGAHLGKYAKVQKHSFVALNTAFLEDGVFVWVPKNLVVEKPLQILSLAAPAGEPIAFFPRHLFVAQQSSQVTLIEICATVGTGSYLSSPVTEFVTEANAVMDHYKVQRESTEAFHMSTFQVHQDRDSNFSTQNISWGGALVRNDVNAVLDGEGCESTLNGLYMVEGSQLVDNHMRVDHAKPHCDSHELFKGILEGASRAVFNGRIFVHKDAQKTDAKQTNRNLLLSKDALCNSNPQLEIFADDVKCTHGSTVGQLDDTAVFYLRSRGIGEEAARSLLTYAFAADIVERIKVEPVRQDLEEFLFRRLPKGDVVRQAV